jgi:phosphoglycerate kinase
MALLRIKSLQLRGKRVILRADLNVPIIQGAIEQDFRLRSILPTIHHIQQNGGKVILATHIGRPSAVGKAHLFDEALSTKHLVPWFQAQGFNTNHEADLVAAHHQSKQHLRHILLLENLRFYNSECETNAHFAELLSFLGDVYINDAFALAHRHDTSVTLLAQQFDSNHRGIGLLMEKEIAEFTKLRENKTDDLVILVGGNKIKDKVPMIEHFMDPARHPNLKAICLGGGIGLAFLKAQGYETGQSAIDDDTIAHAQKILTLAGDNHIGLRLPLDHRVALPGQQDLMVVDVTYKIPEHGTCVDIGPRTMKVFSEELAKAKIIFSNGTMGIYEQTACRLGTCGILEAIAKASGYSVVGGGNTASAIHACNLQGQIDFLSTGGGAMLAFLGCENPEKDLPALAALAL